MIRAAIVVLACLLLAGCDAVSGITESQFARTASDTASVFAAAARTIEEARTARLTTAYAKGSFVNYAESVEGVEDSLASDEGGPSPARRAILIEQVTAALEAVDEPCLEGDCDWAGQVEVLKAASEALVEASEQAGR